MGGFSTLESNLESTSGLFDAIVSLSHKCLEIVHRDQHKNATAVGHALSELLDGLRERLYIINFWSLNRQIWPCSFPYKRVDDSLVSH